MLVPIATINRCSREETSDQQLLLQLLFLNRTVGSNCDGSTKDTERWPFCHLRVLRTPLLVQVSLLLSTLLSLAPQLAWRTKLSPLRTCTRMEARDSNLKFFQWRGDSDEPIACLRWVLVTATRTDVRILCPFFVTHDGFDSTQKNWLCSKNFFEIKFIRQHRQHVNIFFGKSGEGSSRESWSARSFIKLLLASYC